MENRAKMANSMAMREAQKHELIELIKRQLAYDDSPLAPIVQDASRLAMICQKYGYWMLFNAHLNGQLPKPNPDIPSIFYDAFREKITQDFQADRLIGNRIHTNPLQLLEEQQQQFHQQINAMESAQTGELPRSELIWDRKIEIDNIFINIRERIETFITELESPSPKLGRAVEIVGSESPMRKDGRIFIGHGRSPVWRELKDFLQETLGHQTDEFNREATAGLSTKERLEAMLNEAIFAFLIMTAENEHADKTVHARENVIHETGLFQGKLGYKKAIVLLEAGCTEFSNIHGLTVIPFPKGNIRAISEDIRQVLVREGIRSPTSSY
jgi:predicted nucleotide-binding protein